MAHGFDVKADDNVFVVLYSSELCSINIYRQEKESSQNYGSDTKVDFNQ